VNILSQLVPKAAEAGIPFLVIGGHAVIAYGFPRQTADLDLLVREEDREAWHALVTGLGYTPYHLQANFLMYNSLATGMAPLDFMIVNGQTFSRLATDAGRLGAEGHGAMIPSLRHLVALKLHALRSGQAHRQERDLLDVTTLVELHAIDLASPDYREIFERYGTATIRAEIDRRLGRSRPPGP
jgi:hypothetical protein